MTVVDARAAELASLRRTFRVGALAVLAFVVAVGGIVAAFGTPADRPAGVAERWLVALSDTTRDGLDDDARERLAELTVAGIDGGAETILAAVDGRLPNRLFVVPSLADDRGAADDGEPRFDAVRVGRAFDYGDDDDGAPVVLVPARVTPYEGDDPVDAYVLLIDGNDGWAVFGFLTVEAAGAALADGTLCDGGCRGFPIQRPERAPFGFVLGTLALGLLITIGCSAAVRAATPTAAAS